MHIAGSSQMHQRAPTTSTCPRSNGRRRTRCRMRPWRLRSDSNRSPLTRNRRSARTRSSHSPTRAQTACALVGLCELRVLAERRFRVRRERLESERRRQRAASGNESFYVHSSGDKYSLSVPAGASATSPAMCISLLSGKMCFVARGDSGARGEGSDRVPRPAVECAGRPRRRGDVGRQVLVAFARSECSAVCCRCSQLPSRSASRRAAAGRDG